jgi:hypothetical protein
MASQSFTVLQSVATEAMIQSVIGVTLAGTGTVAMGMLAVVAVIL